MSRSQRRDPLRPQGHPGAEAAHGADRARVVLGVAMVSGTFVLTDSIDKAFDAIFSEVYSGTDATITGKSPFDVYGRAGQRGAAVRRVAHRRGAGAPERRGRDRRRRRERAAHRPEGQGDRLRRRARTSASASTRRAPSSTRSRSRRAPGRAPTRSSSMSPPPSKKDLEVGDEIGVAGGRAGRAVPDLRARQVRLGRHDRRRHARRVRPADRAAALRQGRQARSDPRRREAGRRPRDSSSREIEKILPAGTQVRTGDEQATEDAEDTDEFISFLRYFLLAFGVIALFVGAFVIFNSLSITIAQRTRELATLRTLGASAAQVR